MLNGAKLPTVKCKGLWTEAARTATNLPGLRSMQTFGEITIVNHHKHNRDVYRFLNLETDKIILSHGALWLNQQCGDWKGITQQDVTTIDDNDVNEPFLDISNDDPKDEEAGREPETEVDRI
jgi:hypothetical protein